jgi:hypothetical protein
VAKEGPLRRAFSLRGLPPSQFGQQLGRCLALSGPKLRERRQRELRLEKGDALALIEVAAEPPQRSTLQLLRLIGGVQQDELECLFETEPDLARCCLGNQDVAARGLRLLRAVISGPTTLRSPLGRKMPK